MQDDERQRGSGIARSVAAALVVAVAAALIWGSDRITLQGERTVYTVDCDRGTWDGKVCSGKLVPGKRYAFRASVSRHEVIYWVRGSTTPSGRYSDCTVVDRDNWSCKPPTDGTPTTIAYEMAKGRPMHAGVERVLAFHSVPKWKWWLIDAGIGVFTVCEQ